MFVDAGDATLMVQSFGTGELPIVAHGGWVGSSELWLPVFELLSASRRTVTYDHRGTGATINRAGPITLDQLVGDLFTVLDRLAIERSVLAAESAGAAVVLEAALRAPDRFAGLCLVAPGWTGTRTPQIERLLKGCAVDFPATMDIFVDACVPEPDCMAERSWGRQIVKRSSGPAAIELMTSLDGVDPTERLAGLTMPVLVLHGRRDAIVPIEASYQLASLLPDVELIVAEDAGHVPTVTRPAWVAERISEWMARRTPA